MSQESMKYLLVSDVFGRTNAIEKIASKLSGSVEIFDPYNSKNMGFKNEDEAYNYFITHVGLDEYADKLNTVTRSFPEQLNLIGFSVGASAVWKISSQKELKNISSATCFYGSQIRNEGDIQPLFPIQLIFPVTEEHFSVSKLIFDLSGRKNVKILHTSLYHGFMNSYSDNFNQAAYHQFIQKI